MEKGMGLREVVPRVFGSASMPRAPNREFDRGNRFPSLRDFSGRELARTLFCHLCQGRMPAIDNVAVDIATVRDEKRSPRWVLIVHRFQQGQHPLEKSFQVAG